MSGSDTAASRSTRTHRRGLAALLVLLGAAGTSGAAFLPWWRRAYHDPLSGGLTVTVDGGAIAAGLVPLALVAVAGLAAAMISRGVVRRVLGVVAGLAAAGSAAIAVMAATHRPDAEFAARLVRPATPQSAPEMVWGAVLLAVVAATVGAVGGIMLAVTGDRRDGPDRAAGLAYRPPAAQREAVRQAAQRQHGGESSPAEVVRQGSAAAPAEAVGRGSAGSQAGAVEQRSAGSHPETAPGGDAASRASAPATDPADSGEWWRSLDAGVDPTDDGRGA